MAVKFKQRLLGTTVSAGTNVTTWTNTENYKNLMFVLRMGTTSGSGSDTIDCYIEAAPTNDATTLAASPQLIRSLTLTDARDNTLQAKFDQVVGGTSLPSDTSTVTTLRQQWDYKSPNVDEYIRLKYVVAGTGSNLGTVIVDMYADEEA